MATINSTSGTTFTEIRDAYTNSGNTTAANDSELRSWTTYIPLSLSYFRGAKFTDGTIVPNPVGPISIGDVFKVSATSGASGKTFAGGEIIFRTHNNYAHSNWSSYSITPQKLQGVAGFSTYDNISYNNKRIELTSSTHSSYSYTILLLSNSTTSSNDPGFKVTGNDKIKRSTIWLRREAVGDHIQIGLIKKDNGKTWTEMKAYLKTKHAGFRDRITVHSGGYVTHSGSASTDFYSTSLVDPVTGNNYTTQASTVNIDNRLGITGGSQGSQSMSGTDTINNSYTWPIISGSTWQYYRYKFDDVDSYLGIDVEYIEFYADGYITAGSTSSYVDWYSVTDFSEMYDGLYVEGVTGVSIPANTYVSDFTISNRRSYFYKENHNNRSYQTGFTTGHANIKVSGYVLRFRWSSTLYMEDTQLGPAYIVLPRKHVINEGNITSQYWLSTDEWSFFVGDTTSGTTNTFKIDIMNDPPGGANYYKNWGAIGIGGVETGWGAAAAGNTDEWSPFTNWANGSSAIYQTYWSGTKTVKGWNCVNGTQTSSTNTGASSDSEGNTSTGMGYLYTEVSGDNHLKTFVFRTEKFNFYNLVGSYANNLYLKFYIHAYGSQMGNLYVYISHLSASEEIRSFKLDEYGPGTSKPWSGFTSTSSPWQEKTIDISRFSSRPLLGSGGWYIYFVYSNALGYDGDLCLDNLQIVETGMLTKVYQFFGQSSYNGSASNSEWVPTLSHDIGYSGASHQWGNGSDAVSGTYWTPTGSQLPVKGWNSSFSTGSSCTTPTNLTGPSETYYGTGNMEVQSPWQPSSGATAGYLYTEGDAGNLEMVLRLPGVNFYREMLDPFSNHVTFSFYYHAYGEHIVERDLRIYIDDELQSNHSNATLLDRYGGVGQATWIDFTDTNDEWKQITIYLINPANDVKYCDYTNDKTWYIYLVSERGLSAAGTGKSDLAIDYLYFKETSVAPPTSNYNFNSHVFTNCGSTGMDGPTLTECKTSYNLTQPWWASNINWWDSTSNFNVTGGIQYWKVPKTGTYTIIAEGASGGDGYESSSTTNFNTGGKGAKITGTFSLTKDEIIRIVVGQKGHTFGDPNTGHATYSNRPGSGGGGSYVIKTPYNTTASILIIAGGGGGAGQYNRGTDGEDAILTTTGTNTASAGQGSGVQYQATYSHGGAGFSGNGSGLPKQTNYAGYFDTYIPQSFVNGSTGGKAEVWAVGQGGFGGGGGAGLSPGGGGGYSGGTATGQWASTGTGWGGSSYNADTGTYARAETGTSAGLSGHGKVTIIAGIYEAPAVVSELYSFTTHTFTNCGSTGMYGPTLTECRNTYTPSWTDNTSYFNIGTGVNAGIQQWTVPKTGSYTIAAEGAEGGAGYNSNSTSVSQLGGSSVRMTGTFSLTEGDIIWIAVGQKGAQYPDSTYAHRPGAGGGGTFVVKASPTSAGTSDILVIAGGGGGAGQPQRGSVGGNATTATHSNTTASETAVSATGSAGYAGTAYSHTLALSYSGAGFLQNGYHSAHANYNVYMGTVTPKSYANGLVGGYPGTWFRGQGGFGGGGGSALTPGGGGGYSGGDTFGLWSSSGRGMGGGSINNGTNKSTYTGTTGHGQVIVTFIS